MNATDERTQGNPIWGSAGYFLLFICLGLDMAIAGPTLTALADQTGSTLSAIGMLFLFGPIGVTVGTILGGWLYDWAPGRWVLGLSQITAAVIIFFIPQVPWLWFLLLLVVIKGIAAGMVNTGANTLILWTHGKKAAPYMNALHFFFGLGSFAAPFLLGILLSAGGVYSGAYRILGVVAISVGLFVLFAMKTPGPERKTGGEERTGASGWKAAPIVVSAMFFLFFYVGSEITFGGWIHTYAVKLNMADAAQAAYLTSIFWLAFTIGRLVSIPLAMRLSPKQIIPIAIGGGALCLVALILFRESISALWIASAGVGFFMAPVYPSGFTLAGQSLRLTSRLSSLMLLGDSFGGMILPSLMGVIIEAVGAPAMSQLVLVSLLATLVAYIGIIAFRGSASATQTA